MHFVYVLLSQKDNHFYIGFTKNIKNRYNAHCRGEIFSTKSRRPLDLIFYEMFLNKKDAIRRESYFKTTKGKTTLKQMLKEYLSKNIKINKN